MSLSSLCLKMFTVISLVDIISIINCFKLAVKLVSLSGIKRLEVRGSVLFGWYKSSRFLIKFEMVGVGLLSE